MLSLQNLGWRYRSPKSQLAIKNCSWRVKTPEEQILAIKKIVINKIADHEFHIVFGHFTLPSLQINSLQTLSPRATGFMLYCTAHTRTFQPLWALPTDGQSLINRLIEHTLMLYIRHACGESTANSKRNMVSEPGS